MGKHEGRKRVPSPTPMAPGKRIVHYQGQQRDIVFAVRADGSQPAKEFYESLSGSDQVKFDALFVTTADQGELRNELKFRLKVGVARCQIGGKTELISVAEFKIHSGSGQRILAYRRGRQWILTNGFAKGEKLANQIKRAESIIDEDLSNHS